MFLEFSILPGKLLEMIEKIRRNLLSNPATCYPIPQPDKRSRNLLSNHNSQESG